MSNPIKFLQPVEFYLKKANQYFAEGDFVSAFSYLDNLEEDALSQDQFEEYCYLKSQMCHTFGTESGNFWAFKYFVEYGFSQRLADSIAYATIENDAELAEYREETLPDFLQDIMSSIGEEESPQQQGKKPAPLMFFSDLQATSGMAEGDRCMKRMKFEEALEAYRRVPKTAVQYSDALSSIALCHLFLGNYKKSYEINKMVLGEFPQHLQSQLEMLTLCNILGKKEEFNKYLQCVQEKKHTPEDSLKIANILIDAGEYNLALPHFEFAFDNLNYSLEGYVTYIVTLFNAGKQQQSKIELKEIIKFFPDSAILRHILQSMYSGEDAVSYAPLFEDISEECLQKGLNIAKQAGAEVSAMKDREKLAFVKYAFCTSTKSLEYFDKFYSEKLGASMLKELLYHPECTMVQRTNILRYLMKNKFKGRVLFHGSELRYLKISYPNCVQESELCYIAYAFAFSTLSYFQSDFETKLKRAMTSVVKTARKNELDLNEYFSPDTLSACVLAKMKTLSFQLICEFNGLDRSKFMQAGLLLFGEKFVGYDIGEGYCEVEN